MNTDELRICGITGKTARLEACPRCKWYYGIFSTPGNKIYFSCRHPITIKDLPHPLEKDDEGLSYDLSLVHDVEA